MRLITMFYLFVVINVIFLCNPILVRSQDENVIKLKEGFTIPKGLKIPPEEKILLTGNVDPFIKKITIFLYNASAEDSFNVEIKDKKWNVLIGPFQPRRNLILGFHTLSELPADTMKEVVTYILNNAIQKISTYGKEFDSIIFSKKFNADVLSFANKRMNQHEIISGIQYSDSIANGILKLGSPDLIQYHNLYKEISDLRLEIRTKLGKIKNDDEIKKMEDSVKQFNMIESLFKDEKDITQLIMLMQAKFLNGSSQFNELDMMRIDAERINTKESRIKVLQNQAISNISNQIERTYYISTTTTARTGGIDFYAGFDVGLLIVDNTSVEPFFLVSPSFGRIDISDDPRALLDHIMLTFGYGLKKFNEESNQYYIGFGSRLNKLFRLSIGLQLYGSKPIVWSGAFSASISVDYIGSLVGAFNTVQK